jgi:riboflavin kinase/FMN adenylyltransferase
MRIFRGFHHPQLAKACALTVGNFDGVHRGHQAMLATLRSEARHLGVPSCVLTFEPHPRDYFATLQNAPQLAPARITHLRDKLAELERCGIDQCVVLRFDAQLAALSAHDFIEHVLVKGLGVKYVLVGDDFKFGAKRSGDYAMLSLMGTQMGFDVAKMNSYEIPLPVTKGPLTPAVASSALVRVSSSAVRQALAQGQMDVAQKLLGRGYVISGHVVYGRQLGRSLNARTLNVRFKPQRAATQGIFVVNVFGLDNEPIAGVANFGVRPSLSPTDKNQGQILLEAHCLNWPSSLSLDGAYGRVVQIELLHKLHDELKYESLSALEAGIAKDCADARQWHTEHRPVPSA